MPETGLLRPNRAASLREAVAGLVLAVMGAAAKLLGGALYGSKALLVDGATCVAAVLSGVFLVVWLRRAAEPPDLDHPYGHERLAYGAVIYTLLLFTFAAGVGFAVLAGVRPYSVSGEAVVYALVGLAFYTGAVALLRRVGPVGASVAAFTSSEILESFISIISAAGGAALSYIIDYAGAWVIEAFILYEAAKQANWIVASLSDQTDLEVSELVRRELEARGFTVNRLRLRRVVPGRYQGDAIVSPPKDMPAQAADMLADEVMSTLESKGIDLTVHVELARGQSTRAEGDGGRAGVGPSPPGVSNPEGEGGARECGARRRVAYWGGESNK
ncbi:hypothetical protein JCM10135_11240 [Stetteria hydrogenophila]